MVIFHSYVKLPEGILGDPLNLMAIKRITTRPIEAKGINHLILHIAIAGNGRIL